MRTSNPSSGTHHIPTERFRCIQGDLGERASSVWSLARDLAGLLVDLEEGLPPEAERDRLRARNAVPFSLAFSEWLETVALEKALRLYMELQALSSCGPDRPDGETLDEEDLRRRLLAEARAARQAEVA